MRSAQRLILAVLATAVVAHVMHRRRAVFVNDPKTNGDATRIEELRRQIEEARNRLRNDLERARRA